jgi:hypothetical protein
VVRVLLVDAPGSEPLDQFATNTKRELRAIGGTSEDDFWTTVHATDTAPEARYVINLFLSRNNRRLLALRGDALRPEFAQWLDDYRRVLDASALDREDACVVGSAVLEAVGVRDSTDIDCIVGRREPRFHGGVVKLGAGVDLVTAGYHRRADGGATHSDADIIADPSLHFYVRGFKFANPELVIDRKRQHGRPKDVADVALWDAQHPASRSTEPTGVALLWTRSPLDAVRRLEIDLRREAQLQRGLALVVAGVPQVRASDRLMLEGPPPCSSLALDRLVDRDPCATLRRAALEPEELLAQYAAAHGQPAHPGETFQRLLALAWTVRWMRSWLEVIRPVEVSIESDDIAGFLLGRLAASKSARTAAATPVDSAALQEACWAATEHARFAADAEMRA